MSDDEKTTEVEETAEEVEEEAEETLHGYRPLSAEERDKAKAQADQIRQQTTIARELAAVHLRKALADAEKSEADVIRVRTEIDLANVNLLIQKANELGTQIALAQTQRLEEMQLSADLYHQIYHFIDHVNENSVHACMERLSYWNRTKRGSPIQIIFTSPGGSVIDGLALFDYIQQLKRDGHHVETNTLGMAASMAGILLQAGTQRVMAKEAWVLIHEISSAAFGKTPEIEDELKFIKRIQERVLRIFLEGVRKARHNNPNLCTDPLTLSKLKAGWNRKDWWLSSDECLKFGLVDEVR